MQRMRVSLGRLTRLMKKYTVSHSVTAAPAAARLKVNKSGSMLKLGLDIHREKFVVAAQYDHATPRPPRGFAPAEFVPWVEERLREGFEVHVVYESCGFGFGLYRALLQAGAHCYVIAPQKLGAPGSRPESLCCQTFPTAPHRFAFPTGKGVRSEKPPNTPRTILCNRR
jgi:hypothetical protein